ncbi:MAG: SemiSWEET transporter [Amphritea sp.]
MDAMTLIGLAAACCTTAAFIPQVLQILRTGNVDGISLGMYSIFTVGVALWLTYASIIGDLPMLLANVVTLLLSGAVLTLTLRHRLRTRRR